MSENEILKYLSTRNKHSTVNKFKKNSVKELCLIMEFYEKYLKTEKGSWSIKRLKDFKEIHNLSRDFDENIFEFRKQYSKRKKEVKTFGAFVDKLRKKANYRYYKELHPERDERILLKNDDDYLKFLIEMKDIQRRYLNVSDGVLIDLIYDSFKTKYSKNTIKNYFYKYNAKNTI